MSNNVVDLKEQVGLKAEDILKPNLEQSYKDIINQDQQQNKTRATQLAILPEEAKKQIAEATQYSSYFPNPITKPFMRKYILAKLEFPTKGSELAQSLTELNVRIDNLFNDAYTYEKAKLEAAALDLEIEEIETQLVPEDQLQDHAVLAQKKLIIQMKLKKLEQINKANSLKKIELAAMARYNEAMGWKGCVEDIMQELGITSLDQFDFNAVRMEEMSAKIKRWGQLQARGALDLSPSKFQAIDSNQESFAQGFIEEQHKVEREQLEHKHQQALAQVQGPKVN